MKLNKSRIMNPPSKAQQRVLATVLSSIIMTGCGLSSGFSLGNDSAQSVRSSANDSQADRSNDRIRRGVYGAIGAGASKLEPDTSEVDGTDVSDSNDSGVQLALGVDIGKRLSLELHTTDLGSAGLSPAGSISYQIHGASALIYAGKNRHNFNRRGLSAYGRVGLGVLENESEGDINFVKDNGNHILFGAGLEYMTRSGVGVRGEAIAFEEDVFYSQLGLIYRFGKLRNNDPVDTPAPKAAPIAAPVAEVEIAKPAVPEIVPVPETVVALPNACSELNGVLDGVNFHSDSEKLTTTAEQILLGVADTLRQCDDNILITAHTDNQGAAEYNKALSSKRAISVVRFLVRRGISLKRFKALAFGESRPIASNETSEGRSRNRRVELTLK